MRVTLPYFYEVEFRREGAEPQSRPQWDWVEHEIRVLRKSDVSVAAEWAVRVGDELLHMECLSWNGDLYLPTVSRVGQFVTETDIAQLQYGRHDAQEIYSGVVTGSDRPYYLHAWLQRNLQLFAKPKAELLSSTAEESADQVLKMLDRLFLSDGRVWQRVSGLHCEVFKGKTPNNNAMAFSTFDYSKDDGKTWSRQWESRGLHWTDELRISLNDIRRWQRFGEANVAHQFRDFVVHDPDSFAFDGRAWFLHRFAYKFLRTTSSDVGAWTSQAIENWVNLREMIRGEAACSYDQVIEGLKAMQGLPLERFALRELERGFATWKKLGVLLEDSDPAPVQTHAFTRHHMKAW